MSGLIDTEAAAVMLGLSKQTLCNWRSSGKGPPFVRLGKAVRYNPATLTEWATSRTFSSTEEADQAMA